MSNTFSGKQPFDEYFVAFNFSNVIGKDTIASAVVTAVDSLDADKTSVVTDATQQNIDGPRVYVWVKGGDNAHGQRYHKICN